MKAIHGILHLTYLTLVSLSMVKFPLWFPICAISRDAVLEHDSCQLQPLVGNMRNVNNTSHMFGHLVMYTTCYMPCNSCDNYAKNKYKYNFKN